MARAKKERRAVHAAAVSRQRQARSRRYALRCSLWKISSLKSIKGCGRSVLAPTSGGDGQWQLLVRPGADGGRPQASYAGLMLCGSLWACPSCSARIRTDRAKQIQAAGLAHLRHARGDSSRPGGSLEFLTLTLPHDHDDRLEDTLGAVFGGWKAIRESNWWANWRDEHGLGFIRAVEITYTARADGGAGWHPHLHVLLFLDQVLSDDVRADLLGKIDAAWRRHVLAAGFRAPRADGIGVNLRTLEGVHGADGLLAYIAKVQDGHGDKGDIGAEMVRGDLKAGRRALSRTPFELAEAAAAGDPVALQLWHEYEQATKGRRAMHWSQSVRALLHVDDDDQADDEQLPAQVIASGDAQQWRTLCRGRGARTLLARLLELAEDGQLVLLEQLLAETLAAAGPEPPCDFVTGELQPGAVLAGYGRAA